ncbi:MAG: class II fructose-1,6-bisphosphate aldolase [Clostridia bacterium]|jgi:fructose-bisphosphate aldolase class II|nr:class II fructose-1,6-bisphosphate aldolase [Clostridia bacterium]
MLVTGDYILSRASEGNYAVGAFNTSNLEITKAIIEAAEEMNSPVIIQTSQGAIKYAGLKNLGSIVRKMAEDASVPVALHLDHGTDFNVIMGCLRDGWSSIMIDGSKHEFEKNVEVTAEITKIAGAMGVSVEAEIGKIGGQEEHIVVDEREASMTDPAEAVEFVKLTNCDSLAIGVGTAHGPYKGEPKLDFDRIETIKGLLKMPLVLHGCSGVPEKDVVKAVSLGINKINIDTDLRQAFAKATREFLDSDANEYDPRKILTPGMNAMKEVVKTKIKMCGSENKA